MNDPSEALRKLRSLGRLLAGCRELRFQAICEDGGKGIQPRQTDRR